jgi:hypothetical protein
MEFLALCDVEYYPRTGDGETVSAILLRTHWLDGCPNLASLELRSLEHPLSGDRLTATIS